MKFFSWIFPVVFLFTCGLASGDDCTSEQFHCENTGQCISIKFVRDGDNDCGDNEDEIPCEDFQCTSQPWKCIAANWLCDGDADCEDSSDESPDRCGNKTECTSDQFKCDNGNCIKASFVRDGDDDCGDGSDERACPEFECNDNKCIPNAFKCDGDEDCDGGEDELDRMCSSSTTTVRVTIHVVGSSSEEDSNATASTTEAVDEDECTAANNKFLCEDKSRCISLSWVRDGDKDCSDNSDEQPCPEFQCTSQKWKCIPYSFVCDGDEDCQGGSDEHASNCANFTATMPVDSGSSSVEDSTVPSNTTEMVNETECTGGDKFLCENKSRCISLSWVRDGDKDCSDNSDERPCPEFQCKSQKWKCIPSSFLCDSDKDCEDGSDEEASICASSTTAAPLNSSTAEGSSTLQTATESSREDGCTEENDKFLCENKSRCIPINWVRDGENDCSDNSDEKPCPEFQCSRDKWKCLAKHLVCNGKIDCDDGSDESDDNCNPPVDPALLLTQQCNNLSNIVSRTVSLGTSAQYSDARLELLKLKNCEPQMKSVITQLYNGHYSNTKRTLELCYIIDCNIHIFCARTLLQEMRNRGHATKPEIFLLQKNLEFQRSFCTNTTKANEMITQLKPHITSVLNKWASDIRSGSYSNIIEFANLNRGYPNFASVHENVASLVDKAMAGNPDNFPKVLKFVKDLPHISLMAPGYLTLVRNLKSRGKEYSDKMMLLSYWIHRQMVSAAGVISQDSNLSSTFANAKSEIPSSIQNVFWRTWSCAIRNVAFNEPLEAGSTPLDQNCNGGVFARYDEKVYNTGKWTLQPQLYSGKLCFRVVNNYYSTSSEKRYLCESSSSDGMCTCHSGHTSTLHLWFIKPVDENTFHFQNVYHDGADKGYLTTTEQYFEYNVQRKLECMAVQTRSVWRIEW